MFNYKNLWEVFLAIFRKLCYNKTKKLNKLYDIINKKKYKKYILNQE